MGYDVAWKQGYMDRPIDASRRGRFWMPYGYQWRMSRKELTRLFGHVYPVKIDFRPDVNRYELIAYSPLFDQCEEGTESPLYILWFDGIRWSAKKAE